MRYNIIHTAQPKRAAQVIQAIENHNASVQTHADKIFLKNLPYEPSVVTFKNDAKPRDHVIGRHIEVNRKAAINRDESTYSFWSLQTIQDSTTTTHNKRRADDLPEKLPRLNDPSITGEGSSMELSPAKDEEIQALQLVLKAKDAMIAELEKRPTTEDVEALHEELKAKETEYEKELESIGTTSVLFSTGQSREITKLRADLEAKEKAYNKELDKIDTTNYDAHAKNKLESEKLKTAHYELSKENTNLKTTNEQLEARLNHIPAPTAPVHPNEAHAAIVEKMRIQLLVSEDSNTTLAGQLRTTAEDLRQARYASTDALEQLRVEKQKNLDTHKDIESSRKIMMHGLNDKQMKKDANQTLCCNCHRPKGSSRGGN